MKLLWIIARHEHNEWGKGYLAATGDDLVFFGDDDFYGTVIAFDYARRWLRHKRITLGLKRTEIEVLIFSEQEPRGYHARSR